MRRNRVSAAYATGATLEQRSKRTERRPRPGPGRTREGDDAWDGVEKSGEKTASGSRPPARGERRLDVVAQRPGFCNELPAIASKPLARDPGILSIHVTSRPLEARLPPARPPPAVRRAPWEGERETCC